MKSPRTPKRLAKKAPGRSKADRICLQEEPCGERGLADFNSIAFCRDIFDVSRLPVRSRCTVWERVSSCNC